MYTLLILLFATTLCIPVEAAANPKQYTLQSRLSANLLKSLLKQIEEYRVIYFGDNEEKKCGDELDDKAIKNLAKDTLRDLLYALENPKQSPHDTKNNIRRLQNILNLNDDEFEEALAGGNEWRAKSCSVPTASIPIPHTTKKKTFP